MSDRGDIVDQANERAERDLETAIAMRREIAARIPKGEPGECDLCGEWSGRLVGGVCASCRDRHQLD